MLSGKGTTNKVDRRIVMSGYGQGPNKATRTFLFPNFLRKSSVRNGIREEVAEVCVIICINRLS